MSRAVEFNWKIGKNELYRNVGCCTPKEVLFALWESLAKQRDTCTDQISKKCNPVA